VLALDCILRLYRSCKIHEVVKEQEKEKFASVEWLKTYCSLCIKALYAKRFKRIKYSVVVTL
jgi:hypothetical protein